MRGEILNAGDNVDNQEFLVLQGHISKLHLQIQMTIYKNLNMQQENLRPQRNKENNDKQTDKIQIRII